ncbi:hypothetical protein MBRA1_003930 [Malassezia brasiliensis]|uniref:Uncharacterized protein n=1 Tax=Malassezia brasiliensis TaxID=1821822 RepID=A0AAF0IUT5_9BASI|nr:hypothetical protein MBRA1_003930 [Malassezia brasiliensis]
MHAVHAGPASPRSASVGEWHRGEFVETPAMRMRWFYEMVDAEAQAARTEPDRTPLPPFDQMVQQHSRASPTLLYPPSSSPPPVLARAASAAPRTSRAPSTADESPLSTDVPMYDAPRPAHARPSDAPEPRTLRFDPEHRLVSYAASAAPPRAEFIRKRARHY